MSEHDDSGDEGEDADLNIAPLFGESAPLLAQLYAPRLLKPLEPPRRAGGLRTEIMPEVGMILCRLGTPLTQPENIFGPTAVELFEVVSVAGGMMGVRSLAPASPRLASGEAHYLAPDGTISLAVIPSKLRFTYVAASIADMEKYS